MTETLSITEILSLANNAFGEENVELKTEGEVDKIIIHFNTLTITSENGLTHDIKDLFVAIRLFHYDITENSKHYVPIAVSLIKSTFTEREALCGYVHSHVPMCDVYSMPSYSPFCFGTGPIKNTQQKIELFCSNDETNIEDLENLWRLYFFELEMALKVESISGRPYMTLATMFSYSDRNNKYNLLKEQRMIMNPITEHKLNNKNLQLSYHKDKILPAFNKLMLSYDFKFAIANKRVLFGERFVSLYLEFTRLLLEDLDDDDINFMIKNNMLWIGYRDDFLFYRDMFCTKFFTIRQSENKEVIEFKGKVYPLKIIKDKESVLSNKHVIINPNIAYFYLSKLLSIINYETTNKKHDYIML